MFLLLRNSFKGLKKKKIQMLGIITMVFLSTAIYTTMNSAIDRIEDRYYNYLEENKVEYVSLDVALDLKNGFTIDQVNELRKTSLKKVTKEESKLLDLYTYCLSGQENLCTEQVYYGLNSIFKKYEVAKQKEIEILDGLAKKYDFEYELQETKVSTKENYTTNVMPYNKNKKINLPYLVDGKFPEKAGEITVLPKFASENNLKIGSKYKLGDKEYEIVGFAYSSDYIYPMLSVNQPIFDEKYNNIVFMLNSDYEVFTGVKNDTYGIFLNGGYKRSGRIMTSIGPTSEEEQKEYDKKSVEEKIEDAKKNKSSMELLDVLFEEESDKLTFGMNTGIRLIRTDMIQTEFSSNRTFAEMFLYLLLSISVFIIVVITKKRVDDERLQIGVLKSLGYKRYKIALSYLTYPVVGSLIGGVLGFLFGLALHMPVAEIFLSYYTVPLDGFIVNMNYLTTSILVPMIMLSALSFLIAFIMLRKRPLDLLKEGSNLKINALSKLTTKITKFMKFESKFRYQLASRSTGKLVIVTLTSFCTGLLIVLVIVGMNLFNSLIDQSFDTMKYKYMVNYNAPQVGESNEDDLILSSSMDLVKVTDENGKKKKLEDDEFTVNLSGIDSYTKYISVKDEKEKNLLPKLEEEENGIIVNKNIQEYMKIEIGDNIVLKNNDEEIIYKVVGIEDQYLNFNAYVSRNELSKQMGYSDNVYQVRYTTNKKYSSMEKLSDEELEQVSGIFSIEELRGNIEKQMQRMNSSIYVVIFFASFMVLVIISVIANIVVEENKKTISLMKVLGYQNKEISSIVLNIYTPFIIVAYLLSIPCMIGILKTIVSALLGDVKMVIPVTLSPGLAILGLVGLLVAYYIAISLSKRVLNKVPLAVALKRE